MRLRAFLGKPLIIRQEKPVLLGDYEPCQNPIFLIGVHRSGTSLIRRMFNSHRKIACPPESFYIPHYCDLYQDPMTAAGFEGFGQSGDEMRTHIARQAAELHDAYRLSQDKPRWADKTPQYTDRLEDLLGLFGDQARFVLIFRDPRDIAYSIYERGWRLTEESNDLLADTLKYVRDRIGAMLAFSRAHPDKAVSLHYEKLVNDPEGELTRVLGFLSEEFDEAMLRFNDFSHNFGTEDPMVRGSSTLKFSSGHWKTLENDERDRLTSGLEGIVKELGYQ